MSNISTHKTEHQNSGLIICSPYEEPAQHWLFDSEGNKVLQEGRRPAGYTRWNPGGSSTFVRLDLVNRIRERVREWRKEGYPGATRTTQELLQHWRNRMDPDDKPLFFCQIEAAETLIWLTESSSADRTGIAIEGDGGAFERVCAKMATGAGKTVVMAMLIAWQVLNKAAAPTDTRFSKHVLVVAPGLTVKERLKVLYPAAAENYYQEFNLVKPEWMERLRQGKVLVKNWHALAWESAERVKKRKSVDKRSVKSDAAYKRDVLGEMANARNILVINDEAHHAWRASGNEKRRGELKEQADEATIWVGGLDRLHRTNRILHCYDFSATPFAPSGTAEETLFNWIVSDFGLHDAIESGLVKTPYVVVRDDAPPNAKTHKSKLYHLFNEPEVRDALTKKANATAPLPDLVRNAYLLLAHDWENTLRHWGLQRSEGEPFVPPVMITVCNRTETAARIKHAFDHKTISSIPLDLCSPEHTLHIDSKVLKTVEERDEAIELAPDSHHSYNEDEITEEEDKPKADRKLPQEKAAEQLRRKVDTVGKLGEPGEQVRHVVSVSMLSEGWDAKTVTHIMGLRAFSSQLLCEQVVGRGLRRTSYDVNKQTGLLDPEEVNVFGVPFEFLPHDPKTVPPNPPSPPKTLVRAVPEKSQYEICWPNVLRIEHVLRPALTLDIATAEPLMLDAGTAITEAGLAAIVVDGKADLSRITDIKLREWAEQAREQTAIFDAARQSFDQMKEAWRGNQAALLAQLVRLTELFIQSDRLRILPEVYTRDPVMRRLVLILKMSSVVQHITAAVRYENAEALELILDRERPVRSTGGMHPWRTGRPCTPATRSHLNVCVLDSAWEASDASAIDQSSNVDAWVRNERIGFEVTYLHRGAVHNYRPDFLVRLKNGDMLIVETKGQIDDEVRAKHSAMEEWIRAVNSVGGFGQWHFRMTNQPKAILDVLNNFIAPCTGRATIPANSLHREERDALRARQRTLDSSRPRHPRRRADAPLLASLRRRL